MARISAFLTENDGVLWRLHASSLAEAWHQVSAAEARGAKLAMVVDAAGKCHTGQALLTLRASRKPLLVVATVGQGSCLTVR